MWWQIAVGVLLGLALVWAALIAALWAVKPPQDRLAEALRLLPDVLRLLTRLARDPSMPRGVRWRLFALLGYLALPIDLVPDFIPIIGYADDAVIIAWALRSVARRAGPRALEAHWPGTPDGLAALRRIAGLPIT
jgi:uncharacterized membrane protein YkvA (DUF1232 family)